jgi:hypothetical protein
VKRVALSVTLFAAAGCGSTNHETSKEHGERLGREIVRLGKEIEGALVVTQELEVTDP